MDGQVSKHGSDPNQPELAELASLEPRTLGGDDARKVSMRGFTQETGTDGYEVVCRIFESEDGDAISGHVELTVDLCHETVRLSMDIAEHMTVEEIERRMEIIADIASGISSAFAYLDSAALNMIERIEEEES